MRGNHNSIVMKYGYYLFILVGFLILSLNYAGSQYQKSVVTKFGPIVEKSLAMKSEIVVSHLWLEEYLEKDTSLSIESFYSNLGLAEKNLHLILKGGLIDSVEYVGLNSESDSTLKRIFAGVSKHLTLYKDIAVKRIENSESSGVGTSLDSEFDVAFQKANLALDSAYAESKSSLEQGMVRAKIVQVALLVIDLFIIILFAFFYYRADKARKSYTTAINKAINSLDESRRWLSITLKSIGDGVIATDKKGAVTFINPVARKLTGYSKNEALGKSINHIFKIVNEETRNPVDSPVDKVLREGKIVGLANHTVLIKRDGSELPIDDSGAPIMDEDGNIIGVVLVFHDFTERRDNNNKINHLNAVLQSIRGVNRLIVQEKDMGELLPKVCGALIDSRSYQNAWIALIDDDLTVNYFTQAYSDACYKLKNPLQLDKKLPPCANKVLRENRMMKFKGGIDECSICNLANESQYSDGVMTTALKYQDHVYGILTVSIPARALPFDEEESLFEEISGDISYAIYNSYIEKENRESTVALKENEEKYRLLFQNMTNGFALHKMIYDNNGNPIDYRFININDKFEEMTGFKRIDILGKTVKECIPDIEQDEFDWIGQYGKVATDNSAFSKEVFSEQFQKWFSVNAYSPQKDYFACQFEDITLRKEAEKAARQNEAMMSSIFKAAPIGIGLLVDRKIKWVSQNLFDQTGYAENDIIGQSSRIFYESDEEYDRVQKICFDELKKGESSFIESRNVNKAGEVVDTILGFSALDPNDLPAGIIFSVQDNSDLKQSRKMLQTMVEKTSSVTGENFFRSLVSNLANTLNVKYSIIGRYDNSMESVSSIAYWNENKFELNFTYNLEHTPCKDVIKSKSCAFPEGVREMFPKDKMLLEKSIDCYLGAPLKNSKGETIGTLVAMDDKPFPPDLVDYSLAIMDIFALRAATEFERYDVEKSLLVEKERAQKYFDSAGTIMVLLKPDCAILKINKIGYETLEYDSESELIGKDWIDLCISDKSKEEVRAVFSDIVSGNTEPSESIEGNIVTRTGKILRINWFNTLIRNSMDEIIYTLSAGVDITERVEVEKALMVSEKLNRAIVERSPLGISVRDKNGKLISANRSWKEIWNVSDEQYDQFISKEAGCLKFDSRDEYLGDWKSRVFDIYTKGGYLEIPELLSKAHRSGRSRYISQQFYAIMTDDNKVDKVVIITLDITENIVNKRNLEEEREMLSVTLGSIGDAVIAADMDGIIIIMNDVAKELTGWTDVSAIGRKYDDIFRTKKVTEFSDPDISEPNYDNDYETILISRDGDEISVSESASPIIDKDGNAIGIVHVFRDITETKRLQELASRAQRLETAGRIAGQVAHDFNNLLGPLVAFPDLVRDELPQGHKVLHYVESMEKSAQKIADINQQLLTLGRRGHYSQAPLNLNSLLNEVMSQFGNIPDSIEVRTDYEANLMNIMGGAAQLSRVLSNLIVNAIDSMPNGGNLTIRSENFYVDEKSGANEIIPKGEYVKCSIFDTGIGISKANVNKIYDPFFTTKKTDKRRGSGLGLSVVHSVLEDHKGYIDVESRIGSGTVFYIYLPITRDNEDFPQKIKEFNLTGGDESILVADDDPIQLDVSRKLLEKLGYNVSLVNSGVKAIEIIRKQDFDLVILDMIMPPGIDGAETYRKILDIKPMQKALIISGYAQTDRVKYVMNLGASEFIRKPIKIGSLAKSIQNALGDSSPQANTNSDNSYN